MEKKGLGVLTNLVEPDKNTGTALIRINMEDMFSIVGRNTCDCGRTLPRISPPLRTGGTINPGCKIGELYISSILYRPENLALGVTGEWEGPYRFDKSEQQWVVRLRVEMKRGVTDISNTKMREIISQILTGSYEIGETANRNVLVFEIEPRKYMDLDIYKKLGKTETWRFFRVD